jgi:hypothetical protein
MNSLTSTTVFPVAAALTGQLNNNSISTLGLTFGTVSPSTSNDEGAQDNGRSLLLPPCRRESAKKMIDHVERHHRSIPGMAALLNWVSVVIDSPRGLRYSLVLNPCFDSAR